MTTKLNAFVFVNFLSVLKYEIKKLIETFGIFMRSSSHAKCLYLFLNHKVQVYFSINAQVIIVLQFSETDFSKFYSECCLFDFAFAIYCTVDETPRHLYKRRYLS